MLFEFDVELVGESFDLRAHRAGVRPPELRPFVRDELVDVGVGAVGAGTLDALNVAGGFKVEVPEFGVLTILPRHPVCGRPIPPRRAGASG